MRPEVPTGKHTLSVLVENKPGVLARIAGLFSRRGFNIDSLAVGPTEHPEISRMTIVVSVEDSPLEQVTKQLNKLVEVIKIVELEDRESIERRLGEGAIVGLEDLDDEGLLDVQDLLGHYANELRATDQPEEADRITDLAANAPTHFLMVIPEKVQADPSISTE